ncbi:MAG: hypothetical protein AB7I37_25190 [Pirellulales bacterium]
MLKPLALVVGILWASPVSLIGLAIGMAGLLTGGRIQRRGPVLECYGGAVTWVVTHLPYGQLTLAMTLGHVVIGQSAAALDISREHERVHVRQFQRWGLFLVPAYFGASFYQWWKGRDWYRDNPFEREAYGDNNHI